MSRHIFSAAARINRVQSLAGLGTVHHLQDRFGERLALHDRNLMTVDVRIRHRRVAARRKPDTVRSGDFRP
jgi:hypothetical protein